MKVIPLPCSFDNYSYLVVCEQSGTAAVVDPTEAYPAWKKAEQLAVDIKMVLCTHHHQDHIGGLADLLAEQPDLKVYGHSSDYRRIPGLTHPLKDGDVVTLGAQKAEVIHTPGHTAGSVCYHFDDHVLTGDTLFGAGCGRLFEGDAKEMYNSLGKIRVLPKETKIYFGHEYTELNLKFAQTVEPANKRVRQRLQDVQGQRKIDLPSTPSSLEVELATNPFLRCTTDELRQGLQIDGSLSSVEIFAMIREKRNHFKA